MKKRHIVFAVSVGATSSLFATADSQVDIFNLSLEELMQVKITPQKRQQHWYEVPSSVEVYDGRVLREYNIHQLTDVAQLTPGLVYSHIGSTSYTYIRGIGSDLISIAADSSTAVYNDDVYLARPQMATAQFWDIDRIEILKGPQGALYGRNATGGAINIIHTKPTFDNTNAYAHFNAGEFSTRQLEAAVNTPVSDNFALRSSVFAVKNNGFTQDLDNRNGNIIDDTNTAAARMELRWQLNSQLENSLTAEHYQNNTHGFTLKPADHKGLAEAQGAIPVNNFHATRDDLRGALHYQAQELAWRWTWVTPTFELQSISAYRNLNTDYSNNTDGTEIAVTRSKFMWESKQHTHEIKLSSRNNEHWHWLAGASWLHETPINNVALIRTPINSSINIYAYANTTAWAVYGEVEWDFLPQWNAKIGLRESNETRKDGNQLFSTHDLFGLDSNLQNATAIGTSQHNESFKKLSPQYTLSYTPETNTGHSLWYLSATEGFKSGGANSFTTRAGFKPEEVESQELGYKFSEKNKSWQLAAFHYDYTDLQVLTYENGTTTITNAADASINGVDANAAIELNTAWSLSAGVTLLNAHYDKFISSLAGAAVDASGNPMPYAPHWDFNQTLNYQHTLPLGNLHLSLQHHYQARTYFNSFADDVIAAPAHNIFNAQALWKINKHWDAGISVKNLTNVDYYETLVRFTTTSTASAPEGNALGVTMPGRQWLAVVNYKF
jgi:iron complex outermembrane recepter protein